jgi:hypothetical protein
MPKKCLLCEERQVEINRILTAYKNDKKDWTKTQKEISKKYQITILSIIGIFVLYIIFGPDIIMWLLNTIKDIIK